MAVAQWPAKSVQLLKSPHAETREQAACNVRHLAARNSELRKAILASGAVPILVELLQDSSHPKAQEQACGTLRNLAYHDVEVQTAIVEAGALTCLAALLRGPGARRANFTDDTPGTTKTSSFSRRSSPDDGAETLPELAASTLRNLATNRRNRALMVEAGVVPSLVELLAYGTTRGQEAATGTLKNLIVTDASYKELVMGAGAVPPLLELLREGRMEGKVEAAGTLKHLAFNNVERAEVIIHCGAVRFLLDMLWTGGPSIQAEAAGAMHTIADRWCEISIENLHDHFNPDLQGQAAAELRRYAGLSREHQCRIVSMGAIEPLVTLLNVENETAQEHSAGILKVLVEVEDQNCQAVLNAGAFSRILEVVRFGGEGARKEATGVLNNLMENSEVHARAVAAAGISQNLVDVFKSEDPLAREYTAGVFRKLVNLPAAEPRRNFIVFGGAEATAHVLESGSLAARTNCAWIVKNLLAHGNEHEHAIRAAGVIPPLEVILNDRQSDEQLLMVTREVLKILGGHIE